MNPHKDSVWMGYETAGDQRIPIAVRDWSAIKLALWRSRTGWEIAVRQAVEIIDRCRHAENCRAAHTETEPCLSNTYDEDGRVLTHGCPDREQRMSALVILAAARDFAPVDARKAANEPYFAPSREYFSKILADFATTQAELEALRTELGGVTPPTNESAAPVLPEQATDQLMLPSPPFGEST